MPPEPASVIKAYRQTLAAHLARGAQQIRLIGEVPHPGMGRPWEWWARYEAAFNHAFAEFPLWVICPYDARIAPSEVLADVARTHPHVAITDGRHVVSSCFEDPVEFLTSRPAGGAEVADFVWAVNEAVDNGIRHGRPPVRLRLWSGTDRMVVTVTDRGRGPTDPLVGLLPRTYTSPVDLGLWLTYQICSHVTHGRDDEGFTIRLVAGVPSLTTP